MKKILLTMAFVLTALGNAWADDVTVPSSITIPQGGTAFLEISLENSKEYRQLFQFLLELPDGISVVAAHKGSRINDIPTLSYSENPEGSGNYQFICASISTDVTSISGTSGVIAIVELKADVSNNVGSSLTAKLTGIEVSDQSSSDPLQISERSFTINIDEYDNRVRFDENSKLLPTYPSTKANVRMTRTIKANEWSTIILPFTLTKAKAEAAFGSDVQLAEFSGFEVDYGEDEENVIPLGITLNFATVTMTSKKGMTGGKPYLIKVSDNITGFTADDVTLVSDVAPVDKSDENDTAGKLTGTLVKSTIPEDGIFISENKFWYSEGDVAVKAFRCWFELDAVLDKATDFGSRIVLAFVDDEKTGIKERTQYLENGRVYDLQGRRVSKTAKNGLYIKDGKKILVK